MIYPNEFHELGEKLLENYSNLCDAGENPESLEESVFRTVIDRAYYSAFLEAREWLQANTSFKPTRTGKDHDLVRIYIKTANITNATSLAGKLSNLKKDRGQASYHLTGGFSRQYTKEDTEMILKRSKNVIDSFK
jgi:uncharacterized protein (UPF0332 family)